MGGWLISPAAANNHPNLQRDQRVKSALQMCNPTPFSFEVLLCWLSYVQYFLSGANFLPYWCILEQIFYWTRAPCRDW